MFKAQVLRRNFSLFRRVPNSRIARSAARDGYDSVIIHRVHIRRPFFSKSRSIGIIALTVAYYGLSRYISIEVEVEKVNEKDGQRSDSGQVDEADEGDEDYDDALLFLPTGLSRPKKKTFYKGSDPEWQEFKKLSTDRPRADRIRNELVSMIRNDAHQSPGWRARIGTIDKNKGKTWIEVKFPDGPPLEYERPGFELTEEMEWRRATRPVETTHHERLNMILFPIKVSTALYNDTKQKVQLSWQNFRAYLGLGQESKSETVQSVVQQAFAKSPSSSSTGVASNPTATGSSVSAATDSTQATDTASSLSSRARELGFALPDPKMLTLDLTNFRKDFRQLARPSELHIPRGSFMVLGLVEVCGDRARVTLNVTAAYDPKQGRYVSMTAKIWNVVPHSQSPKGGP